MESKNYAEVLIDGEIYTLEGQEEEAYLQKVASYLNEKISLMKKQKGFTKQNRDYQVTMVELNMADDYFKSQERAEQLEEQNRALEKETYSLKHELVTTQMKLEKALHELEEMKKHVDVQLMISRHRHELLQKQSEALKETINVLKTMQNEKR